ncbi:helix-turn-helix domain-containing protein [Paramicrobacterium humi]|uniref:helix-turn-helix domain-containing protein n=1 Tax=Paramicrobacterium humi TaxID=640635 RepID=UPI0015A0A407|nr:helix-turn-helix transcriptional regulator [Microbacterium humi]
MLVPQIERERANPLGAYLQARRGLLTPQQAGVSVNGVRRVPGLRREELAMLAGISADYYLRLERGKDRNPSARVLDALGHALQLDNDHMTHLKSLASDAPRPPADPPQEEIPVSVLNLIGALDQPAFIEDEYFNILASNPSAQALNPHLSPGRNQMRDLFLDESERALHPDWEMAAACLTASLRHTIGNNTDDPHFLQLINDLSRESSYFRHLWARHDVRAQRGANVTLTHPQFGERAFTREQLRINGTERIKVVVYYAREGNDSRAAGSSIDPKGAAEHASIGTTITASASRPAADPEEPITASHPRSTT